MGKGDVYLIEASGIIWEKEKEMQQIYWSE